MESFIAARQPEWSVMGLPAFNDNYLWAIVHEPTQQALVVDPGCGPTVQKFLEDHSLHLSGILVTHHHPDHIGGIDHLINYFKYSIEIIGIKRVNQVNKIVSEGDFVEFSGLKISVMEVPGHTRDHLAYFIALGDQNWLFCGDTLFSGGCGRLFEGTAEDMFNSLHKINNLPSNTQVFCAHEYTESNLKFAIHQEPENPDLKKRFQEVQSLRRLGKSTIPSCLSIERESNLFLKCESAEALRVLRLAKDQY
jgi:hydroxyacylglutathione hydrolase